MNIFPIKELEQRRSYLIGVSDLTEVKTYCVVRDDNYIVDCGAVIDDEEFYETIERLSKYYNTDYIKESEKSDVRQVGKIPSMSRAISDFLKTDKGKEVLLNWCYDGDLIDVKLLQELINFK